jgi:hypothetical protein
MLLVSTLQRLKAPFIGLLIWITVIALVINAFITINAQNCSQNKTKGLTLLIAIGSLVFIYFKAVHYHIWPKRSSKFTGFSAANEMARLAKLSDKRMKTVEEAIEYWLSIIEKAEDNLDEYEEEYKDLDISRKVTMVRTGLVERGRSISHDIKAMERSQSMDTPYSHANIYSSKPDEQTDIIRNNSIFKPDIVEYEDKPITFIRRNALASEESAKNLMLPISEEIQFIDDDTPIDEPFAEIPINEQQEELINEIPIDGPQEQEIQFTNDEQQGEPIEESQGEEIQFSNDEQQGEPIDESQAPIMIKDESYLPPKKEIPIVYQDAVDQNDIFFDL